MWSDVCILRHAMIRTPDFETRRGFFSLFVLAATGAAASVLSGCEAAVASPGGTRPYVRGVVAPAEVVKPRAKVSYENIFPKRVPAVRTMESAGSIYAN